jgi:thymidylate synthase (FAD)
MALTPEQLDLIESQRSQSAPTIRPIAPALEEMMYKALPVLDHGFVRVVDYMGTDESIVQAARVSYGKGTKKVTEDQGLINYLMRHRHTTPFEMCEIKYHIKMPIFVARQWIRHRTANVNEFSARYSLVEDTFYIPELKDICSQSVINNQGRGETIDPQKAKEFQQRFQDHAKASYAHYEDMLDSNVARELARVNLPLNTYTEMYWKIDLHNLLHFLSLRADSHAQYEIRVFAEVMLETLKAWVPMTYDAFMNNRMEGAHFSKAALDVIGKMIKGEKVEQADSGLSKREWSEVMGSLKL